MDAIDLNFTHSIVGPPVTVALGTRSGPSRTHAMRGLEINLRDLRVRLDGPWLERWLLHGGEQAEASRAGRARQWLERHALVLAGAALVLLVLEAGALAAVGLLLAT